MDNIHRLATRMLENGLLPLHKQNLLFYLKVSYLTFTFGVAVFVAGYLVGHNVQTTSLVHQIKKGP